MASIVALNLRPLYGVHLCDAVNLLNYVNSDGITQTGEYN